MAFELLEKFKPLAPWFASHRRDCWLPVVEDGDGSPIESKFSGRPWLSPSEQWPACGSCQQPMALFLQLNLTTVPGPIPKRLGAGLLQAFFCIASDLDCIHGPDGWDPFTRTHLLRIVVPGGKPGSQKPPSLGNPDAEIPVRRIVSWEKVDDYPSMSEAEELGLLHEVKDRVVCANPPYSVPAKLDEFFTLPWARNNEKLGGWPGWVNINTEYPDCPTCGRRMDFLIFQFGFEGFIPIMFGDGGQGQIVACPEHPNILAYPWTCG